ncbi:MAG: hypothetical protein ACR2M0_05555 [Chloroflexia bacterium]
MAVPLLIGQQTPASITKNIGEGEFLYNATGFFPHGEQSPEGPFRWSGPSANLDLPPLGYPLRVRLRVQGARPEDQPPAQFGASAGGQSFGVRELPRAPTEVNYNLPFAAMLSVNPRLELTSTVFQPPTDPRELGTAFFRVETYNDVSPSWPAPWPATGLLLGTLLTYVAARALTHRTRPAIALAVAIGIAAGLLNAFERPWLIFYAWYLVAPPPVIMLLLPWLRPAVGGQPSVVGDQWSVIGAREPAFPDAESALRTPHSAIEEPDVTDRPWPITLFVTAAALAVLAWHFISPLIPSGIGFSDNATWGTAFYAELPPPLQALGVIVVVVAIAWALVSGQRSAADGWRSTDGAVSYSKQQSAVSRQQPEARAPQSAIRNPQSALVLGGVALFSLLPARVSQGDSLEFDRRIPRGDLWRERELLDWYLHARLWAVLQAWLPKPTQVYALVSTLAGGAYLAGAWLLGRAFGRDRREIWLLIAALVAIGNIVLFFGYVESYSLLAAGSLFVIWACRQYTDGRIRFGAVGAIATVTALLHGSALWWGPMVLAAWLLRARALPEATRWKTARREGLEGVGVGLAMLVLMFSVMLIERYDYTRLQIGLATLGGGDSNTLMQLVATQTRFEHYTFFTWAHLGAVVQEQLLTAPLALLTVLAVLAAAWQGVRRLAGAAPGLITLAVGAASVFFYSISWNADLGSRSDWDLLSLPALPMSLLAVYLLIHLPPGRARRLALTAYLSMSAVHAAAWVLLHALGLPFPLSPLS